MRAPPSKLLGRSREPAAAVPSLSSSRSRRCRLRNSRSVKGGQSPMFASVAGGRRKGVAFEAAEPTSPKVTCIGQVRVKSKKKKAAAVVRSRSVRGRVTEASLRRVEDGGGSRGCMPSRKHKWTHRLPVRINCLFPCGGLSLCSRSGEERGGECGEDWWSSNAAAPARWPVSVPQSEEGKQPGVISVVVEEKVDREMGMVKAERAMGQELGFEVDMKKRKEVVLVVGKLEEKEEEVQICIPPRNALLLMRCRSDPVKMAALATRLLDSPAMNVRIEESEEEEETSGDRDGDQRANSIVAMEGEEKEKEAAEARQVSQDAALTEQPPVKESGESPTKSKKEKLNPDMEKQTKIEEQGEGAAAELVELEEKGKENATADEEEQKPAVAESEKASLEEKTDEGCLRRIQTSTVMRSSSCSSMADEKERTMSQRSREGGRRHRRHSFSSEGKGTWSFSIEKDGLKLEQEPMDQEESNEGSLSDVGSKDDIFELPNTRPKEEEDEDEDAKYFSIEEETGQMGVELPACLLLMMYEPKLSTEVSQETWVCRTDFLHQNCQHPSNRYRRPSESTAEAIATMVARSDETNTDEASEITNKTSLESKEVVTPMQDVSDTEKLTANAVPMATRVLALTRCKSEPIRSSLSLAPDACLWRDRRRPIGATGVGS